MLKQPSSEVEAISKSLGHEPSASQEDCTKTSISDQEHRLKIVLSYPPSYYHNMNEQGRIYNLIKINLIKKLTNPKTLP